MIKKIEKTICLPYGVTVIIDLAFPIGENYIEEAVNSSFIDDVFTNQIVRGVREVITKYSESALPINFIEGQKVIVTTNLPYDVYGSFDTRTDIIYLDPDRLSIAFKAATPEFIFAHEIGHKIQKYRDTASAYEDISHFFGISPYNTHLLGEVYSDIVGNIIRYGYLDEADRQTLAGAGVIQSDEPIFHLDTMISPEESSFIKRRILHNIYHI